MGYKNEVVSKTFLKMKSDKVTNVPSFYLLKKNSDGKYVEAETFTTLTGFLRKIELSSYQYEGDTIETIVFNIDDDEDQSNSMKLECGFSYLSRSVLNSLDGADSVGHIKINLYMTKSKTDDKKYPSAYVEVNKVKAGWKYQASEIPKVETLKVGGKTVQDDSKVNEFFKRIIDSINGKIVNEFEILAGMGHRASGKINVYEGKTETPTDDLIPDNDDSDSLPF